MSVSQLLFLNKEIPEDLIKKFERLRGDLSSEWMPEKGHDSWWDRCFMNTPPNLPKYHYSFALGRYTNVMVDICSKDDPNWFSRTLRYLQIEKDFICDLIKTVGEDPLYVILHVNHVITEDDLKNVIEFNFDDYDFREGYAPKELMFEINRFYRLTVR